MRWAFDNEKKHVRKHENEGIGGAPVQSISEVRHGNCPREDRHWRLMYQIERIAPSAREHEGSPRLNAHPISDFVPNPYVRQNTERQQGLGIRDMRLEMQHFANPTCKPDDEAPCPDRPGRGGRQSFCLLREQTAKQPNPK